MHDTNGAMLAQKPMLDLDELDAQFATELPQRDTMLVTVVITNVLNNNTVEIDVRNIQVAAQICAALLANANVDCDFTANN